MEMMDLSEKGSISEDMNTKYPDAISSEESQINELKKTCTDCQTTKTPLWRGGPAGPKSLCNACGIRHRKKRRALLGLNREGEKNKKKKLERKTSKTNSNNSKLGVSLKQRLMGLGREVLLEREMREEEQAAVLLMALSCSSSVYA